jgi:hypothetical protein
MWLSLGNQDLWLPITNRSANHLECMPGGQLMCGRYLSAAVRHVSRAPGQPISETLISKRTWRMPLLSLSLVTTRLSEAEGGIFFSDSSVTVISKKRSHWWHLLLLITVKGGIFFGEAKSLLSVKGIFFGDSSVTVSVISKRRYLLWCQLSHCYH